MAGQRISFAPLQEHIAMNARTNRTAAFAFLAIFAFAGAAVAQDKPSTDSMKADAQHGDAMKNDAMKNDAMKGDAMKGDAMKGDAMKGDAMKSGK